VPYAPLEFAAALQKLGVDACATLDDFNTMPGIARPGTNAAYTHEMAEMAINCWAQWELNNQPVWIVQHMGVAMDGAGITGACAQRHTAAPAPVCWPFRADASMYPGDEDNGSSEADPPSLALGGATNVRTRAMRASLHTHAHAHVHTHTHLRTLEPFT
jgi:hypothetical protein